MSEILDQHRRVLQTSAAVVAQVQPDHLDAPTPCTEWAVRDLLAHMIGQNYGFAAAATEPRPGVEAYAPRAVGTDAATDYAASVDRVLTAFATPGLLDRQMYLAEVRGGTSMPASIAVGFHLVDYVAHGWDVARAIDVPIAFDEDALAAALRVAEAVPEEAKTLDRATPFHPAVVTSSGATLDRILALLGRSPTWTASAEKNRD